MSDTTTDAPPAAETPAPAEESSAPTSPAPAAAETEDHGFTSVDDAVAALRETRAEAAARRVEAKELKAKVERFDNSLAGYKPDEIDYLLDIFHDLSDPKAQKKAAAELAKIAKAVTDADGDTPTRPTGEEDPDEKPLTKKEWQRLETERDTTRAQEQALQQIEKEASEAGYPPDSLGYSMLLSAMLDPEVAGDVTKAAAKVGEYETSVIDRHRKTLEDQGQKWPGAPESSPNPPADPESGPPIGFANARAAATAFLKGRPGR